MKTSPEMKGIYMQGDIYWFRPSMVNGTRGPRVSLETKDYIEAISRAAHYRANPTIEESNPWKAEIEAWLATPFTKKEGYSPASKRALRNVLNPFVKSLPKGTGIADVRKEHVQATYDKWLRTRTKKGKGPLTSPATAHKRLMSIRAFFRLALKYRKVRVNPCVGVVEEELPGTARVLFCTEEQRDRLIKECDREDLKFVLMMGFHAGLRKNEIIQSVAFWFILNGKGKSYIELRSTPTMRFNSKKRARTIPMKDVLYDFIMDYGLRSPFMLQPNVKQGKNLYRYDFDLPLRRLAAKCELPWVTAHVMRHTFASLLVQDDVAIYKVAQWIGDSVATTEKHYAHLAKTDKDICGEDLKAGQKRAVKAGQGLERASG